MDNSNFIPIIEFFAPSETSHRPWESTSPAPNFDLCPELIAIGQNQPFSIAEVLSFNQEDNALLDIPRESVNVAPGFKNKTRYTPYVSPGSQISHIATNRGNINRQCLYITNLVGIDFVNEAEQQVRTIQQHLESA